MEKKNISKELEDKKKAVRGTEQGILLKSIVMDMYLLIENNMLIKSLATDEDWDCFLEETQSRFEKYSKCGYLEKRLYLELFMAVQNYAERKNRQNVLE